VTVAAAVAAYIQMLQATGRSPHTLHSAVSCLHSFITFTGNIDTPDAAQQAVAFLAHRAETLKINSLRAIFSHLKCFQSFCVDQGWLDRNPLERMHSPRAEIVVTMPLSDVEIFAILKESGPWERAMVILLLGTGMRIGELAKLTWPDVGEGVLLLRGKGNKQRTVAPGVTAMRELMRLPRGAKVFPFTREAMIARLHRVSVHSGVLFHAHQFRHTYAHRFLEHGNIEDLAEILGHNSIETTRTYLRAHNRERMLEAMQQYNPADILLDKGLRAASLG